MVHNTTIITVLQDNTQCTRSLHNKPSEPRISRSLLDNQQLLHYYDPFITVRAMMTQHCNIHQLDVARTVKFNKKRHNIQLTGQCQMAVIQYQSLYYGKHKKKLLYVKCKPGLECVKLVHGLLQAASVSNMHLHILLNTSIRKLNTLPH